FGQQVLAIVDHLEVAVQWDGVHLALVSGAEVAEEGRNVGPLQVFVGVHAGREVFQVSGGDEVAHPLRVEDESVVAVGLGRQVGERLLIEVAEGDGNDVDFGPSLGRELGRVPLQRLGDLRAGEGEYIDLHALVHHAACGGGGIGGS